MHNFDSVVSNTTNPAKGEEIAFFCVVVMLGNLTPRIVDWKSEIAHCAGDNEPVPSNLLPATIVSRAVFPTSTFIVVLYIVLF